MSRHALVRAHSNCILYGDNFGGQYGWAAIDLQIKRPTFKDLESSVGNDALRAHYRMASHGVHASPKGIFSSIASMFPTNVLLAGPSNAGLAEAGNGTARTLVSISSSLLTLSQSMDYQVMVRVMMLLLDEIGPAFSKAHRALQRDEVRRREAEAFGNALLAQHGITENFEDYRVVVNMSKRRMRKSKA